MRVIDNNYHIENPTALKKRKRHSILIERKTFSSVASHSYLWITTYLCKIEIAVGDNANRVNKPVPLDSNTCYPPSIVFDVCDYFVRYTFAF